MTEQSRPKRGGFQPTKDGRPRARGGTKNKALRPGQFESPGPERRAAAQIMFESQPGATCETVAAEVGVPVGTVRWWKSEGGWKPAHKALPNLSARAGQLADTFTTKMSELGKPLDDSVAAAEAAREISTDVSIDMRAQVLDRHRKEWAAPRQIAYEAIKQGTKGNDVAGAFERAKLAKITSETLTLIQVGECRAFGINHDARAADARTIVLVDRTEPDAPAALDQSPDSDTSTTGEDF